MESKNSKQEQFKDIIKLIESKNYNEAKDLLNKLLDEKKNDFYIYQLLGIISQYTGNLEESIYNFNLSLNMMPKNAGVLYNLGIINRRLNNLEKAKENFFKSLEINPSFIDGYINIAQICEKEKKIFDADNYFQKAFSIKKDHPTLNRAYAKFLFNIGELKKGLSYMYKNFGYIRFGKSNVEIN